MKKIISMVAALAMLMSTSVFAIVPDGCTAPKAAVTCTKTSGPDEWGYNYYQLKISLSDLGTLSHTQAGPRVSGDKINSISIDLRGDKALAIGKDSISGSLGGDAVFSNTQDYNGSDASGINIIYYSSDAKAAYPTSGSTTTANDAIIVNFFSEGDAKFTLSNATIGFLRFTAGSQDGAADEFPLTLDKTSFDFSTPVVKDIAIEATAEKTTATGCIWNVALTNAANINEFKATFKAEGAEDAVRYIRNIADVASAVSGEGSLNFQVGVLTNTTTKTGIKAAFDVKDSDGKTASTGDVAAAAVAE